MWYAERRGLGLAKSIYKEKKSQYCDFFFLFSGIIKLFGITTPGRPQLGNIRPKRSIFVQIGVKNARHPTGCLRFLPEFSSKLLSFRVQKQFWDTDFSLRCNNEKSGNADAFPDFFVVIERKRWFQNRFFPIWGRPSRCRGRNFNFGHRKRRLSAAADWGVVFRFLSLRLFASQKSTSLVRGRQR